MLSPRQKSAGGWARRQLDNLQKNQSRFTSFAILIIALLPADLKGHCPLVTCSGAARSMDCKISAFSLCELLLWNTWSGTLSAECLIRYSLCWVPDHWSGNLSPLSAWSGNLYENNSIYIGKKNPKPSSSKLCGKEITPRPPRKRNMLPPQVTR